MQIPVRALTTIDGLTLAVRQWPAAAPRGHVLIVHGLGEHAGRYEWLAGELVTAGWSVSSYDQRGHGASPGRRGDIPHADSLLQDLSCAIDLMRLAGAQPLVLLGHSLGGVIAARMVAEGLSDHPAAWYRPVDALVLSSPALNPGMTSLQMLMLRVAGTLAPHLQVGNGLKPDWISRDPAVVLAYATDALVHDRVTASLVSFLLAAGRQVLALAPQWRTRTLLLWAGADRCVDPSGSARFAGAVVGNVVVSRAFGPLFHEIFNEPERHEVLRHLQHWLDTLSAAS